VLQNVSLFEYGSSYMFHMVANMISVVYTANMIRLSRIRTFNDLEIHNMLTNTHMKIQAGHK